MSRRPPKPQLPHALEQLDPLSPRSLADETTYAEVALTDLELPVQHARGVALESVVLRRVDLSGSRLEGLRLLDATFTGCNLANLQARGAEVIHLGHDRYSSWKQFLDHAYWSVELK